MQAIKIIKETPTSYKLVCQLTLDDLSSLPDKLSKDKLCKLQFTLDNIISYKGYWFRPCFTHEWSRKQGILGEPPIIVESANAGDNTPKLLTKYLTTLRTSSKIR